VKKRFLLTIIKGRDAGKTVELNSGITLLGRLESQMPGDPEGSSRVVIADMAVSRTHCKIVFTGQGPVLYHMSKTNATYVNTQSVQEHVLLDGELVQLGHTQLKFQVEVLEEIDFGPAGDWSDYEDKTPWKPDSQTATWEPTSRAEEPWVPC
jgi:pSer/pThr/pTyr-binding forkhead associated (FHA) protein